MARRPHIQPRTLRLVVIAFAAIQWISLYWALRRWTVGTNGLLLYIFREDWIPPLPTILILAIAAFGAWLVVAGVQACLAEAAHDG